MIYEVHGLRVVRSRALAPTTDMNGITDGDAQPRLLTVRHEAPSKTPTLADK